MVGEAAHPDANIIFGANVDEALADQIWVTVVATRFDGRGRRAAASTGVALDGATLRRTKERRRPARPGYEARPRDLGIDVPEFLPG